jgi:acyl carrier protein
MLSENDLNLIRQAVREQVGGNRSIRDDTALISGGLIDSMSIVELILRLQAAFAITIPASEVQPDDFDTVAKIADVVTRFR